MPAADKPAKLETLMAEECPRRALTAEITEIVGNSHG